MKDGIYKLLFNTNVNRNGVLDGILTVRDGHINGGDYVCYYKGVVKGNKASVMSIPHNKSDTTAFNGKGPLDLDLTIEEQGSSYVFQGYPKDTPSHTIHGEIHFLSDLA